ncbi:MAG: glycosyltransferase family 4 protein [Candidatus Buchananbacteria bacterium]
MRILSIGSGTQIFQPGCEDRKRMAEYGKMSERFDILISCVGHFDDQQISDGVFLHATNSKNKLFRFIDSLKIGNKLMKENKSDTVFVQDPLINGLIGWLLAKKHKAKLMVSVFGTSVFDKYWQREHWYNIFLKYIGMKVMKDADVIQTDGIGNFEVLKQRYREKVFWKPVVPSDIHEYLVDSKLFLPDKVRLLFVGRLAKQKNIAMLAEVIRIMSVREYPFEAEFTIVGDGPERKWLKGLENFSNIKRVNFCNRQELNDQYKNNDILLMTSFYEGFPRVFMEAAVNGLAFVVTDVSGAKNIIDEGKNGFIIKQKDVEDFVAKTEKLISDRELLGGFSKHTLESFSTKYDYNLSIQRHNQIMDYLKQQHVK